LGRGVRQALVVRGEGIRNKETNCDNNHHRIGGSAEGCRDRRREEELPAQMERSFLGGDLLRDKRCRVGLKPLDERKVVSPWKEARP